MGEARRRTYNSYRAMLRRCSDPRDDSWAYYGGRGITVDPSWLDRGGFERFLADVGLRPEGMTLDRIDPTGDYEPSNVRWATPSEQRANRRDSSAVEPPPRVRQAARHARFHEYRGDADDRPLNWLTVGSNPPRIVEDDCLRCDVRGPITDEGLCGGCAS